jgi:hypothetical protein
MSVEEPREELTQLQSSTRHLLLTVPASEKLPILRSQLDLPMAVRGLLSQLLTVTNMPKLKQGGPCGIHAHHSTASSLDFLPTFGIINMKALEEPSGIDKPRNF